MNWPEAFTYLWMILLWVFGIAAAKGFWITLGAVLLPPMAWVIAAQWALERF